MRKGNTGLFKVHKGKEDKHNGVEATFEEIKTLTYTFKKFKISMNKEKPILNSITVKFQNTQKNDVNNNKKIYK